MKFNTPQDMSIEQPPRVTTACEHCRVQKKRCSHQKPCANCTRATIECVVDTSIGKTRPVTPRADHIHYIGTVPETTRPPTLSADDLQLGFAQLPLLPAFLRTSGSGYFHKSLEGTVSHNQSLESISSTIGLNDFDKINSLTHDKQRSYCNQEASSFPTPKPPNPFYSKIPFNEAGIIDGGAEAVCTINHQDYTNTIPVAPELSQSSEAPFTCLPLNGGHPWFSSVADWNPSHVSLIGPNDDQFPATKPEEFEPIEKTENKCQSATSNSPPRCYTSTSSVGLRHSQGPLPLAIDEKRKEVAVKRERNKIAARRHRERRAFRLQQLEEEVQKLKADCDRWKEIAMAHSCSQDEVLDTLL